MFVFTLQFTMATVTMETRRSFVKHHFLIVFVPILNQIIKLYLFVAMEMVTSKIGSSNKPVFLNTSVFKIVGPI